MAGSAAVVVSCRASATIATPNCSGSVSNALNSFDVAEGATFWSPFAGGAQIPLPHSFDPGDGLRPRYYSDTLGAKCPWPQAGERAIAILYTGQSTATNWGSGTLYTSHNAKSLQGNIFNGLAYLASDPVIGGDGTGGSPASAIPDSLIDANKYDRVLMILAGFGTTSSAQWASSTGYLAQSLRTAWALANAYGYTTIKHIHQQGELDAALGTSQATMLANLQAFDAWRLAAGINCPLYISRTTFNADWTTTDPTPANWTPGAGSVGVRAAQAAAPNGTTRFAGPDTDTLRGPTYGRNPTTHWQLQAGWLAAAQAWAGVL